MLKLRKNLRDSFAMALEEMENVVGGEIVGQTDEEIKILEEEAVKQGVEIQQDLAAVEECCADIETLQEQLGENDKKLTDPDIVVTAVDVEVSEECYKGMAFKYGVKNPNSIRFSHESVLDAVKAEPRRYLAMSSEGIKEFIIKIWEKIKAFFRKIGEKLGLINKVEEVGSDKVTESAKNTNEKAKKPKKLKEKSVKKIAKQAKVKITKESLDIINYLKLSKEENEEESAERVIKKYYERHPLAMIIMLNKQAFRGITDEIGALNFLKQYKDLLKYYINMCNDGRIAEPESVDELYVRLGTAGCGFSRF